MITRMFACGHTHAHTHAQAHTDTLAHLLLSNEDASVELLPVVCCQHKGKRCFPRQPS